MKRDMSQLSRDILLLFFIIHANFNECCRGANKAKDFFLVYRRENNLLLYHLHQSDSRVGLTLILAV